MYCFLLFFLKCVLVWDRPLEMTVAVTSTSPGCTTGRPMREKSLVPASKTLSSLILSPMLGGQYPSMTRRSPSVTRHCLPNKCTMAKFLEAFCLIMLLHSAITSFVVSETDLHFVGATVVMNLDRTPAVSKINCLCNENNHFNFIDRANKYNRIV